MYKQSIHHIALIVIALGACTASLYAEDNTVPSGEEINWQVISSGGENDGSSPTYRLSGTVGQTAVGAGGSDAYGLSHGFWQELPVGSEFLCGDSDASGAVDIDDVVHLIQYIFAGGPAPVPYAAGEVDCTGAIDIDDVVYLIAYIFSAGPAPCANC